MLASVIMCFFRYAEYELPKRNLVATCNWLEQFGVDVIVVQAVQPGQAPVAVPMSARHIVLEAETAMFRKENLWNIGAKHAKAETLIFLDSDIWIDNQNWVRDTVEALKTLDVTQPMSAYKITDKSGYETDRKLPVAGAIASGEKINLAFHHPGFAWALNKKTFDRIGGFYDTCVSGAGDAAFAIAMAKDEQIEHLHGWLFANDKFFATPSFGKYRTKVLGLKLKVDALKKGTAHHLWHGTSMGRNYVDRDRLFPRLESGEHDLRRKPTGILEWNNAEGDRRCREYFRARNEDGHPPWLIGCGVPKSGTNSLHHALGILGLTSRHLGSDEYNGRKDIHQLLASNAAKKKPLLDGILDVDALVDSPMPEYWKDIADQYQEAKFVLTYRPPHDCALSWMRMIYYKPNKVRGDVNGPEYLKGFDSYAAWVARHNSDVLNYFKKCPERLLVIDCRDPSDDIWQDLRRFVGRPPRKMYRKYPHAFSHSSIGEKSWRR